MRKISILILLIFYCGIGAFAKKYALIIAIGDYPTETQWGKISSSNDVPLIKDALLSQGFSQNDITIILDSAATKKGIINALTNLQAKIKKGDIVVIHYSGHGQQIFDDNGDEADGLDEALVPYDACAVYNDKYQGQNHIRDDELGNIMANLRNKLGKTGQLLFILDSCHSGSMSRGQKARGGRGALVPPDWSVTDSKKENGISGIIENVKINPDAAPFVMISGASAEELNYEYKGCGSLSYSFSQAMAHLGKDATYRQLFAKVLAQMQVVAPFQNPVIEGDIDFEIFSGNYSPQKLYFNVKKIENFNSLIIPAGKLHGLFEGTEVIVMPAGSAKPDSTKAFAKGTISTAEYTESVVTLNNDITSQLEKDLWVFVTKPTYDDMFIKVYFDLSVKNQQIIDGVENYLNQNHLGEIVQDQMESDITIIFNKGTYNIAVTSDLQTINNTIVTRGESEINILSKKIFEFAQGQYLKNLQLNNQNYEFSFRLVPINSENYQNNSPDQVLKVIPGKDQMWLEVTNKSSYPLYISIVEINSKGEIASFFPHQNCQLNNQERMIPANKTYVFKRCVYSFSEPYEKLTLKGFASPFPLDLQPTVESGGTNSRGANANPLENLIKNTFQTSRGASARQSSYGTDGYSTEFIYEIIKK
ncbi:MAG: caspase family protein [Bacteroidetes bacterium]|nr:caspase family protein [Bacteroidota bacterium]